MHFKKKRNSYFKVCFTGSLFSTVKKRGGNKHELWLFPYLKVIDFSHPNISYTDKSKSTEQKLYGNSGGFPSSGITGTGLFSKFTQEATQTSSHYMCSH